MGCQTIAEGIETRSEYQTIHSLGVNLGQGNYFARPAFDPLREIPPKLFFIDKGLEYRTNGVIQRSETVSGLISILPTVHSRMRLNAVGELFEKNPELWSIPVVDQDRPVGIVP